MQLQASCAAAARSDRNRGAATDLVSVLVLMALSVHAHGQLQQPAAAALPPWDWSRIHTWCFPGCDPSDGSCSPARYSSADAAAFAKFDLVLFQGQNYTNRGNDSSWDPAQEAESVLAAQTIRRAGGAAKPTFPYIQFSMPQSWYEHQAHFNEPTPANMKMWLKDSTGKYVDALTAPGASG